MNSAEAIVHLGAQQGARLRPVADPDELERGIPYFRLRKDGAAGGYAVDAFAYRYHDNADRMPFLLSWLQHRVLPHVRGGDLSGYYSVELHDSYTHLPDDAGGRDYSNCLVWSKHKSDFGPILLPDVYHIAGYGYGDSGGPPPDELPWAAKDNKVAFFGTTTGSTDPAANERLRACKWRVDTPGAAECCDFFITKVAQMAEADVVAAYGAEAWGRMRHAPVPPAALRGYKFNLDIPGNTCSWDRVPLVLASRSLLFKLRCSDMCFYYPLLRDGTHYAGVADMPDVLKRRAYFLANQREHEHIVDAANRFARDHLTAAHAQLYAVALFSACAHHRGR